MFVIYYPASPADPSASYCVDLTTGDISVLPVNTLAVTWTNKPTSNAGGCRLQGVLQITPPIWANSVSFHMTFDGSQLYSFNIGDSPTNSGLGKTFYFIDSVTRTMLPFIKMLTMYYIKTLFTLWLWHPLTSYFPLHRWSTSLCSIKLVTYFRKRHDSYL